MSGVVFHVVNPDAGYLLLLGGASGWWYTTHREQHEKIMKLLGDRHDAHLRLIDAGEHDWTATIHSTRTCKPRHATCVHGGARPMICQLCEGWGKRYETIVEYTATRECKACDGLGRVPAVTAWRPFELDSESEAIAAHRRKFPTSCVLDGTPIGQDPEPCGQCHECHYWGCFR